MIENEIIRLRQKLHKYPELSNNEYRTSERISEFITELCPDEVINLSKTGKAFVFNGQSEGKTLIFRAELDALPINETSGSGYSSVVSNVAHSCGHDGHMAIIAGLGKKIASNRPSFGKAVLLFQPAEEVEQGAKDVIEDENFNRIEPDYIFALHNIPGIEANKILIKKGTFAAASKGMTVKLFGKTSHAAEPENGISPANAIAKIIREIQNILNDKRLFKDLVLATIIHIRMGEISFGTSPGYAEMMITLRSFQNNDMDTLTLRIEDSIEEISAEEKLKFEFSYDEVFPATICSDECYDLIKNSLIENNFQYEIIDLPFKWSEDFGYYTQKYKGGFFGLGSGINQPQLHNPEYDFPDNIIDTGIDIFYKIYINVCKTKND